ncbi:MAG: Gfo/Idh/MocA family oxidoreductase, partial [Christensenellales bacterium]
MKWALIGYGGMGHWHVDKLNTMPELFSIAGIYDICKDRSVEAEEKGMKAYASLEALLADPAIELVTIATPNDVHKPIAIQAMAAGKHVISEKPVTLSSDDLQAMIDASKKYDRIFSVHQNRRWDEDYLVIKQIYEANTLGRVFNIESRVHGSRGVPGDWRNMKLQGGGMILDWGVHMLDQILQIVPEDVISVYNINSHVTNDEVDDGFKALITFASGSTALVEVGTSNFINLPRWYMQGENGTAIINDWALNGEIVMVSDWEKRDAVPVVTAAGLTKTMAPRTEDTIKRYPLPEVTSDVRDYYK